MERTRLPPDPGSVRQPRTAGEPSDLTRLLEAEVRLEELLRRAREEAARLVAEARETARAREAALGEELEAAARRLADEIAVERQRREEQLATEAQGQAQWFERVGAERIAELARGVVEQVVGSGG